MSHDHSTTHPRTMYSQVTSFEYHLPRALCSHLCDPPDFKLSRGKL